MKELFLGVFLGGCAWTDGRKKEIDLRWLGFFGLLGAMIVSGELVKGAGLGVLAGVLPGIFLLLAAVPARGQIGFGDGMAFLISGLFLDVWKNSLLLFFSLILMCFWCFGACIWKKRKITGEYPFLPYVFAVYLIYGGYYLCI